MSKGKTMEFWQNIKKVLTRSDVASNGSHQGGILIPKNPDIISYFPALEKNERNPRRIVKFIDENNAIWKFTFIYYNSRLFNGTRNEYRLTGMTSFLRLNALNAGDELFFLKDDLGQRYIKYAHSRKPYEVSDNVIQLSNRWVVIKIKEK